MAYEIGSTPLYEGDGGLGVATTGNTLSISYPSSIAEDDLLVIAIGLRNYTSVTRPAGWEQWDYNSSSNIRSYIWAKRADGTETGSLGPLTHGTANPVVGVCIRISGARWDLSPTYEAYEEDNWGVSAQLNIPAIETYNLGRLAFAFLFTAGNYTLADDASGDWSEEFDYQTATGSDFSIGGYSIYSFWGPGKGIISADTVTHSYNPSSVFNHSWAFTIRPPLYNGVSQRMKINGIEIGEDDDQVGSYMGHNVSGISKIDNVSGGEIWE